MDIFRALLCLGLVLLVWKFQVRGIRPVRDFLVWGTLYPIHFIFSVLLILVIWGVIGADFGLQGLFLDEDPLTQVLLGSTVMILFAAIITHYSVVGESSRGWRNSLKALVRFFQLANPIAESRSPIQLLLRNDFLNLLEKEDIDSLALALENDATPVPQGNPEVRHDMAFVDEEIFRLLVSPAVILVKGFMLMFLVGVVPALIIPLLTQDPMGCVERLPWLLGVFVGNFLGIAIACVTTQWATSSAHGRADKQRILASIRHLDSQVALSVLRKGSPHGPKTAPGDIGPTPLWVHFLLVFFIIHFLINNLLPDSVASTWLNWQEHNYIDSGETSPTTPNWMMVWDKFPWLPFFVLAGEVAASGIIGLLILLIPRYLPDSLSKTWIPSVQSLVKTWAGKTIRFLSAGWAPFIVGTLCGVLGLIGLAIAIIVSPESPNALWPGLRGYASLGSMLGLWIGGFWLATHFDQGKERGFPTGQILGGIGAFLLLGMDLIQVENRLLFPVAWLAISLSGSTFLASLVFSNPVGRAGILLFLVGFFLLGVVGYFSVESLGMTRIATKMVTGLGIMFLGSIAVSRVAERKPSLLFPLTVFLSFLAFAIPYNSLPEELQASMPAAGSIACFLALLAAIYSVLVFARQQSAFFIAVGLFCLVILWSGVALFVNPNHFKTTFPHMANYYSLPVYLDSRDYFRSTTPTTVQLHNRSVIEDFDRLNEQGDSQRLATAYFRKPRFERAEEGQSYVSVSIDDLRGRLRAVVGDQVRLTGEEWFTVQLDGKDCIALAEEPFFQKIFSLFHYRSLDLIRDGTIRGQKFLLVHDNLPATALPKKEIRFITYQFLTNTKGKDSPVGIRFRDLAGDYRKVEADYALISMNWTGRITAVDRSGQSDSYTVRFEVPKTTEPFSETELEIMGTWLERCHLDVLRETIAGIPEPEKNRAAVATQEALAAKTGDCLILDDCRAEAPAAIGTFLVGDATSREQYPGFSRFWLTKQNLENAIDGTPRPNKKAPGEVKENDSHFTLRRIHDRGIFACTEKDTFFGRSLEANETRPMKLAVYNSERLRAGDRILLTWDRAEPGAGGDLPFQGSVFEVLDARGAPSVQRENTLLPPGFQWLAVRPVHSPLVSEQPKSRQSIEKSPIPLVGEWQIVQPLNNTEVLLSWKNVVGNRWKDQKPKLVLITVSGGGIRSSVWTSIVLKKLEATLGSDFPYHIRLITGASGGMVGASYYAMSLMPPTKGILQGEKTDFSTLHNAPKNDFFDRVATGQLDSLLGRMVFADIPGTINPFMKKADRGRTLEETWVRWTGGPSKSPMGRPLQSFAADERIGWRPSMVYTPMMVEDGRRLLISNLDMAFATRNIGGLLIEPSSRKIDRASIQGGDFDLSIHDEDDVFSLSAVEFYRLFPQAHDFRVTTAARMSASFPWISPAVNLPTLPPRRVVDAAYYDNYGVNLSALWISKMSSWLQENTSGVLVIQIRDNVSQVARTEIDFDRLGGKKSALDRLTWDAWSKLVTPGLQAITTPLIGISSARQWTMAFRNDEQVDLLDLIFDEENRKFFRTVVFECPVDVSLSWKLSEHEKEILLSGFGHPETAPREELTKIKDYMIGKDSYELHKWQVENRNNPNFHTQLKEKYDEQLRLLGFRDTNRFTLRQSQILYENVMKNLKRLDILSDWWKTDRK